MWGWGLEEFSRERVWHSSACLLRPRLQGKEGVGSGSSDDGSVSGRDCSEALFVPSS